MRAETIDSKALHSGEYVERYNRKSLDRVAALSRRMRISDQDEVADFACGNGMLLQVIGDRRGCYHGVDFSEDFIASAEAAASRLGLANYRFHCRDIVNFCADHQSAFDVAATLDFSEHIDDASFIAIYSAIRSSLRLGGRLYLHTPNLNFFLERLKDNGVLKQFPEHIAVRNGEATVALLRQAGFRAEDIRVRHIAHYNVLKLLHPLHRLPLIGKYFAARLWIEAVA